jgi:hypothetical protein
MSVDEALAILGQPASLEEAESNAKQAQARYGNIKRLSPDRNQRFIAEQHLHDISSALEVLRQCATNTSSAGTMQTTPSSIPLPQPWQPPARGRQRANLIAKWLIIFILWVVRKVRCLVPRLWALLSWLLRHGWMGLRWCGNWCRTKLPPFAADACRVFARHWQVSVVCMIVLCALAAAHAWKHHRTDTPAGYEDSSYSLPERINAPSSLSSPFAPSEDPRDAGPQSSERQPLPEAANEDSPPPTPPLPRVAEERPTPVTQKGIGKLSIRIPQWGTARIQGHNYEIPTSAPLSLSAGQYAIAIQTVNAPSSSETLSVQVLPDSETLLLKPKGQPWEVRYLPWPRRPPHE